jgi:hypothetical protein
MGRHGIKAFLSISQAIGTLLPSLLDLKSIVNLMFNSDGYAIIKQGHLCFFVF